MTISGMTGFGRAEGALGPWTWAVEARSVNGRNLEVRFRGPPGFEGLERAAREGAQARFQRGQLAIGLQAKRSEGAGAVRLNLEQLERYLAAGAPYVASGQAAPPSRDGLLALRGVIEVADATLRNDLGRKRRIYAREGVPEYWVVDVKKGVIHQMWAPEGDTYAERREVAFGERIEAVAVAGLVIETDGL